MVRCFPSLVERCFKRGGNGQKVETNCQHTFCLKCMVDWQRGCAQGGVPFTCPTCRQVIGDYQPFQWPRLLIKKVFDVAESMDSRQRDHASRVAALEGQLRVIEEQRNGLLVEQTQIQRELERDKQRQQDLQDLLNEFRATQDQALKTKDAEMRKLQAQIESMEREKRQVGDAELAAARARMRELENAGREREGREAALRQNIQELEQARARHVQELQAKEEQLASLLQRRRELVESDTAVVQNDNNAVEHDAAPQPVAAVDEDSPQSPLYDSIVVGGKWVQSVWSSPLVTGSVNQGGRAIKAMTQFVRKAFVGHGAHTALLCKESAYVVCERRGNHYASPVWRARVVDAGDEDPCVAIKFRRKGRDGFREAMLLHELAHPNLISLVGVFESQTRPDTIGLVLPFVEVDLEFWLASESTMVVMNRRDKIVHELVAALAYMHQNNVVHRALTPASVLLEPSRDGALHARVASLTNAVSLASAQLPPLIARGTRYRSPELVLGDASQVSNWKAVDVWAVGAIVWELLTRTNKESWPLVENGTPSTFVDQLLQWDELRAAASQQDHPAIKRALAKGIGAPRSMVAQLDLMPESTRSLVFSLLSWEPSKRMPLHEALLLPLFSSDESSVADAGHFVEDPRALSDDSLARWIEQHITSETQ